MPRLSQLKHTLWDTSKPRGPGDSDNSTEDNQTIHISDGKSGWYSIWETWNRILQPQKHFKIFDLPASDVYVKHGFSQRSVVYMIFGGNVNRTGVILFQMLLNTLFQNISLFHLTWESRLPVAFIWSTGKSWNNCKGISDIPTNSMYLRSDIKSSGKFMSLDLDLLLKCRDITFQKSFFFANSGNFSGSYYG